MKIIAGKYKNRIINSLKTSNYRPSTNKFRQALFSILSSGEFVNNPPFIDANILDLFAGTGSLAFEGLSRGAATITLIDNDKQHLKAVQDFADKIDAAPYVNIMQADATKLLPSNIQYDLVFMDPPYYKNLINKTLKSLIHGNYLKHKTIIAIELPKREGIVIENGFFLIKERIHGNNKLLILQYEQE